MNYYNEFDPKAAAWLRELIRAGLIPAGDVDERSIEDVRPDDLRGYVQCHFFAGIGGWAYAMDLAGFPRSRSVWTGSCPCQPFSAAGKGAGFEDERHLWPAWQHLIAQCRPSVVFGEQVASKAADAWIDLVQSDLEGMGYAFGCVPFPAAGIGAPHIRDRNYWMGYAIGARLEGHGGHGYGGDQPGRVEAVAGGSTSEAGAVSGLADMHSTGCLARREGLEAVGHGAPAGAGRRIDENGRAGPLHGFWADADWLLCRDGKWRPVMPGSFPLVARLPKGMVRSRDPREPFHPAEARVTRLRGYGNAIVPQQAAIFIQAAAEAIGIQLGEPLQVAA